MNTNDFRGLILTFKGDKKFDVHFCFQDDHGHGQLFSYDTDLKRLDPVDTPENVFKVIEIGPTAFGKLDVENAVLRSVKFGESAGPGNATFGFSTVLCKDGNIRPADLNLTPIDCQSITTCP